MYDICVIGGGPAGLTAALYSLRAGRSTLLMEEKTFGGQMAETSVIENMPGSPDARAGNLHAVRPAGGAAGGIHRL